MAAGAARFDAGTGQRLAGRAVRQVLGPRWWPIVQGRVDQAIAAGFDGAYLDMIVTYEEIPASAAGTESQRSASKMVDLIDQTSRATPKASIPISRLCLRMHLNCIPGPSTYLRSTGWAWRSCSTRPRTNLARRVGALRTEPTLLVRAPASWC